jgi:hypothetical protein
VDKYKENACVTGHCPPAAIVDISSLLQGPEQTSGSPAQRLPEPTAPPTIQQTPPKPPPKSNKRAHPSSSTEQPQAKRQSKWSQSEDQSIIEMRGRGMKWEDISRELPGRSAISCRLHYQNYLERRAEWDEERKNKLARLYERYVLATLNTANVPDSSQRCGQKSPKKWQSPGVRLKACTGTSARRTWLVVQALRRLA